MWFVVGLCVAAFVALGYDFFRRSQLRRQRVQAYHELLVSFREAVWTGTELLSVQLQTGSPHELDAGWSVDDRAKATRLHSAAFVAAATARRRFDAARYLVDLVGSDDSLHDGDQLGQFLHDALYSGVPWTARDYPSAALHPVDIAVEADRTVRPLVLRARRELLGWRRREWRRFRDLVDHARRRLHFLLDRWQQRSAGAGGAELESTQDQ